VGMVYAVRLWASRWRGCVSVGALPLLGRAERRFFRVVVSLMFAPAILGDLRPISPCFLLRSWVRLPWRSVVADVSTSVLLWHLCSVGALLDGARISNVGWCFHRCRHSPPTPRGRRWMVVRGPRCAGGCHHQFHGRSS
jgi:hypothetical protein